MKRVRAIVSVVAGVILSVAAQGITIDSISHNGSMSFWGAQVGTTAKVEWAASLTDAGRTNWYELTNVLVTSDVMTNDIPMFFRVRGFASTNLPPGLVAWWPMNGSLVDTVGTAYPSATSGVSFGPGEVGLGVSLANGGYIDIPDSPALENQTFRLRLGQGQTASGLEASGRL